jgi:uncharacterized protein YndB with AHSA1/START domain
MASSLSHGSFTVEREYPFPPERVFAAWTTEDAKREWFATQEDFIAETFSYTLDCRVGGVERLDARLSTGSSMIHETTYRDIVPNERIVATYEILINNRRISVSVFSIELTPTHTGTRLVRIEDGVFLDGLDTLEGREAGVTWDAEAVARYLESTQVAAPVA